MSGRPSGSRAVDARSRAPLAPKLPETLATASLTEPALQDEAALWQLEFVDRDLSGAGAESVECERCRFQGTDLSDGHLVRTVFTDCVFERGSLANLRAERSALRRATLDSLRMTGMSWVDGVLRDVTISDCRADLTLFRFSAFHNVRFYRCNLARADFENADLTGVWFTDCDLTSAQFSQARMTGTRLTNCELAGVGGVTSFSGATIRGGDPMELTRLLASALGIRLEYDFE